MAVQKTASDASSLKVYLLDMGLEKYGDCVLASDKDTTILVDGGHPRDWKPREGMKSIPEQLEEILGSVQPFKMDLIVVTHCHSDHIGCLPDWALLPDEKLGFGRTEDYIVPDAPTLADRMAVLLREEDHASLSDKALEDFISDVLSVEKRYNQMIDNLKASGTKIVRFGRDGNQQVEDAFQQIGLKILGPSPEQFKRCAEAIAQLNSDSPEYIGGVSDVEDATVLTSLYRQILTNSDALPAGAEDRPGKGAAVNCQSILLKLGTGDGAVLLTGDMQFASPEVSGIASMMRTLRKGVRDSGPYSFIKLSHHASYNGFNDSVMKEWKNTEAYGISGGQNDTEHPDPGVLQLLEENTESLVWGRTDHNGLLTVDFSSGKAILNIEKGTINDPVPNSDITPEIQLLAKKEPVPVWVKGVSLTCEKGDLCLSSIRWKPNGISLDYTLPSEAGHKDPTKTAVVSSHTTGTPLSGRPVVGPSQSHARLGGGRVLPPLLFITSLKRLVNNIGALEADAMVKLVQNAKQTLYDVKNPVNPYPEVRAQLLRRKYKGVVIVGGYDVLPSQRLDTLPPSVRSGVGASTSDADNFIVWCDDIYGDFQGDAFPDLPVSRVPDAKSPKLLLAALASVPSSPANDRFGIRNVARPFANGPFNLLPGSMGLLVSQFTVPADIGQGGASSDSVYFMLHGSDMDGSRFWGETQGGMLEAVNVKNVPKRFSGVVFTGCCWGALTVQTTALRASPGVPLGIRTTGTSMPISYLRAGVLAFVGCTGTHYSPTVPPYNYFGGPMHTAFWKRCRQGEPPAQALFNAKLDYLQGIPHGQTDMVGQAIEFKILKEFTCLGLGW